MSADEQLCACENTSHSDLGPVQNAERLGRVITSPNHVRKDGSLKPGTFPPSHINAAGLSLIRVDHLHNDALSLVAKAIALTKAGEELKGLALCKAETLRQIRDEQNGARSLCVIDDPVKDAPPAPDNPAHAIAIKSGEQDETEVLRIRGLLIDIFSPPVIVAEV